MQTAPVANAKPKKKNAPKRRHNKRWPRLHCRRPPALKAETPSWLAGRRTSLQQVPCLSPALKTPIDDVVHAWRLYARRVARSELGSLRPGGQGNSHWLFTRNLLIPKPRPTTPENIPFHLINGPSRHLSLVEGDASPYAWRHDEIGSQCSLDRDGALLILGGRSFNHHVRGADCDQHDG